ncbi:MAG: HlyC/CorC family transporter [Clostridia bacterium]|nr:HlyC/CorC family transporter [Clostridia bacterium]
MDADSWLSYAFLLLLFLGSAYFACAETAFSSANRIRLKTRADDGDRKAGAALSVLNDFDGAITAMLIGNNVCHILLASMTTLLATRIWGKGAVAVSTAVVTFAVFLFCETIPKNYAAAKSDAAASALAPSLKVFIFIFKPLVFVLSSVAKLISKLFGKPTDPTVTEEELHGIIDTIADEGTIEEEKGALLQSAMDFDDRTAQDIFTARVDLETLDVDTPADEVLSFIKATKHSRIPVYKDTVDNIIGILIIRKYLKAYMKFGSKTRIRPLLDPPFFVHRNIRIDDLLREMSARKLQLSVVKDDYGGTLGIVTVEDILEELVGEIWDEDDEVTLEIRPLSGSRWEASGSMLVTDAFDAIGFEDFDEEDFTHKTLGGWALEQMQDDVSEDAFFLFNGLKVTVSDIENRRINKLILELLPREEKEEKL